jgi:hypothetical protein
MTYEFRVSLFVPEESPELLEIDGSVLGRDVLDHGRLICDGPAGTVEFEVTQAQFSHPY